MSEIATLIGDMRRIHDAEDAWHGPGLRKLLADVTSKEALASTVEGYRSIWESVLHVSHWEEVFCIRLAGTPMDQPDDGDWPEVRDSGDDAWKKALVFLDQAHERLIQAASKFNDTDLERIVVGEQYTVSWMLHGSIRHHVYHAGQIALMKRLARRP